jgi:hypothetical protein
MAVGALSRRNSVRPCQREAGAAVVERRTGPCAGAVALRTSLRKARGHVVRIRGALEILEVTRYARRFAQIVVVINVAIRALPWWHHMRTGQREASRAVIEGCIRPRAGGVALGTSLREIRGHMVRVRRALEVLQVTRNTRRAR